MTSPGTVVRLAWRNLRRHGGTGLLLVLALSAATTTLSLALAVAEAAQAPWERTFAATHGAHVVADGGDAETLAALADEPGVASHGGPWPLLIATARIGGADLPVRFVGRDDLAGPVDRPVVVAGSADLDGVVLERSFADSLGVGVGEDAVVGGERLAVTGVAVSVAQAPFPATAPGLAWVSRSTAERLALTADVVGQQLQLVLEDPAATEAFVTAQQGRGVPAVFSTWQENRAATLDEVQTTRVVLLTVSLLLALLTTASVAVVVATGMTTRVRQVGVLKAVGLTPRQITAVVLAEQLALATLAVVVGLAAGTLLAPPLARAGTSLLSGADAAAPGLTDVLLVAAMAVAVVLAATVRPSLRAARASTVTSLGSTARVPGSAGLLARLSTSLPLPMALGVRSLGRRPSRSALAAGTVALSATMVVAAMSMERSFQVAGSTTGTPSGPTGGLPLIDPALLRSLDAAADERLRALVYVFTAVFVLLGLLNLAIVGAFFARDQVRNHALLRALGFTRRQTVASVATGQAFAAAVGCLVGIPLGLVAFRLSYAAANGETAGAMTPPAAWLLPLPVVAAAAAAALAGFAAHQLARTSPAAALAGE